MPETPYERAKRAAAASARRIASRSSVNWPLPRGEAARDAFERDLGMDDDFEDDGYGW